MRRANVRLLHALSCLVLAQSVGCAGDGVTPVPATAEFDVIQRQIFDQSCLSAGCHNAQSQAGGLNLSPGVSFDNLVAQVPDNMAARDQGLLRVEPFVPDNSFLLTKLTDPGPGEGTRMPRGAAPLPASEIELIRDWILNGAPPGVITPGELPPTPTPSPTPS